MGKDPELNQRLLELAYGLLSEEEAGELRQRIDADPELAHDYAEAERTAHLFSEAAKLQLPKVQLARPEQPPPPSTEPARPRAVPWADGRVRARWARWAEWSVAAAAGVLLVICLGGWLYHRAQLADIAADHLRLQVTGPAALQAGVTHEYSVMTTSITGRPVSAQVEFALYSPDLKRRHREKTDERGLLKVTVPADLRLGEEAKLEVLASYEDKQERVAARLPVEPVRYQTQLTLDKPLYRPGETVRYRSLTLCRFGLAAAPDLPVQFEILDPGGAPLPGSRSVGVTRQGVGCGEFRIPDELAGGKYTLVARGFRGAFPDQQQTFLVRSYQPPRLKKELLFSRAGYVPGETVVADFSAHRAEGGPAAGTVLKIIAAADGEVVHQETAQTSSQGTFRVEFALPDQIERADAQLVVVADDGGTRETVARTIPVNLGPLDVTFRPEGGQLVANLENRVYFAARNSLGRLVDICGTVVGGQGRRLAKVETTHAGMGTFSMMPFPGEQYYLEVDGPGSPRVVRLPEVAPKGKVVLNAGLAVFQIGEPLEFNVRAAEAGLPLVASAWCRGVVVGQQSLVTHQGANPVAIPVQEDAGGVIRLTIYNYSVRRPALVAERLVYRRPARRLHVDVVEEGKRHAPGDEVALSLSVKDEAGRRVPATSSVAVFNDALRSLADDPPQTTTQWLLGGEVGVLHGLDGDFYLSEGREAAIALDLLLGTRPYRPPAEETPGKPRQEGPDQDQPLQLAAPGGPPDPPAMFDNLAKLQQDYQESLATYQAKRTRTSSALTGFSFFGGVGLVMLVAMLSLLNIAGGARLWGPAILAATVCLIVGSILMAPLPWKSRPEGAVAFMPFHVAPTPPEAAEKHDRAPRKAHELERYFLDAAKRRAEPLEEGAAKPEAPDADHDDPIREAFRDRFDRLAAKPAMLDPKKPPPAEREGRFESDEHLAITNDADRQAGAEQLDKTKLREFELLLAQPADDEGPAALRGRAADRAIDNLELLRFDVRGYRYRHSLGESGQRNDFAEVPFWNPLLPIDAKGKPADADDRQGQVRFRLPDSLTTFAVLVDVQAAGGRVGSGQTQIVSRLPFSLEPKLPPEVTPGDRIDVPLAVVNRTSGKLPVQVVLEHTELVQLDGQPERSLQLEAEGRRREYFALNVVGRKGDAPVTFRGTAGQFKDEVTSLLKVVPPDDPSRLPSDEAGACPVQLATQLARQKVPWGETVALSVQLSNPGEGGQPRTVAVLGLPAGLEVRPDQLEEIQAAHQVDSCRTRPRQLICSWQSLEPNEKVALKLDLIAAIPGKYSGPASCVYLEQDADRRHCVEPLVVEITPD